MNNLIGLNKSMNWEKIFNNLKENGYIFTKEKVNFKLDKIDAVEVQIYWEDCFLNSKNIQNKKIFFGSGTAKKFIENFNELIDQGKF